MSYQVWIEDEAKAEMKHLPGNMRQQIRQAIENLVHEPRPHYSRQMDIPETMPVTVEIWRLRLEHWRVIYLIDDTFAEIGILAIRKRPPYDYDDLSKLLGDL